MMVFWKSPAGRPAAFRYSVEFGKKSGAPNFSLPKSRISACPFAVRR